MSVTLYVKPGCPQCVASKLVLNKHGIPFDTVDLSQDADALEFVKSLGHSSAPVVHVSDEINWSGFRPDRIEELKQLV